MVAPPWTGPQSEQIPAAHEAKRLARLEPDDPHGRGAASQLMVGVEDQHQVQGVDDLRWGEILVHG